ncbi:MAG: glycosyltransferase [Alcaligenaceae bacterium]|nr:MAG: glycosyltransferase [Alcaligenaceae bacterium]
MTLNAVFAMDSLTAASGLWNAAGEMAEHLRDGGGQVHLHASVRFDIDEINTGVLQSYSSAGLLKEDESQNYVIRAVASYRNLREICNRVQAGLIVSHTPQADMVAGAVAARLAIPWVPLVHNWPIPQGESRAAVKRLVWKNLLALQYRKARTVIAVSNGLAEQLRSELVAREYAVVQNAVALSERRRHSGTNPTLGLVGRLSPEKDPLRFVRLAAESGSRGVIVGDGELRSAIEDTIGRLSANVKVLGWVPREQSLDSVDVLIMPSLREGLPLILLEAAARGIPILASDVGGVADVLQVDSGVAESCLLDKTATDDEWLNAIESLQTPEVRNELGGRLFEVTRSDFNIDAKRAAMTSEFRRAGVPRRLSALVVEAVRGKNG